jgi:hypothetical protein
MYDHCCVIWQALLFVLGGCDSDLNTAYSFQKGQWEVLSLPRVKSLKPYLRLHLPRQNHHLPRVGLQVNSKLYLLKL